MNNLFNLLKLFLIFLLSLNISEKLLSQNINDFLIAYYPFDGEVRDVINNQNPSKKDVTAILTSDRNGKHNSAYEFNGIDTYIKLPININPNVLPEVTITCWVMIRKSDRTRVIFSNGNENIPSRNLYYRLNYFISYDKIIESSKNSLKPFYDYFRSERVDVNDWIQVALIYHHRDSLVKMIIDGEEFISKCYPEAGNKYLMVGMIDNSVTGFTGKLDDIRIFSKALTNDELFNLFGKKIIGKEEREFRIKLLNTTIGILIAAFYIFAVVFMLYTLIFKRKPFNPITKEMMESRSNIEVFNAPKKSNRQINQQAWDLAEQAFKNWTLVSEPDEDELRTPTSKKQIKKSLELLNRAIVLNPTEQSVIDRINELGEVINVNMKRVFAGSVKLIICSVIVTILYSWIMASGTFWDNLLSAWFLWAPMLMYVIASFTPQFLIEKRNRRMQNRTGCLAGLGGFFLGLLMAEPATETYITRWSDGTTTRSQRVNPFYVLLMGLAILLVLFLAAFMFIWAAIAFIRNYILYI